MARNLPTAEDPRDDIWLHFVRDVAQELSLPVWAAVLDAFTKRATMLASR